MLFLRFAFEDLPQGTLSQQPQRDRPPTFELKPERPSRWCSHTTEKMRHLLTTISVMRKQRACPISARIHSYTVLPLLPAGITCLSPTCDGKSAFHPGFQFCLSHCSLLGNPPSTAQSAAHMGSKVIRHHLNASHEDAVRGPRPLPCAVPGHSSRPGAGVKRIGRRHWRKIQTPNFKIQRIASRRDRRRVGAELGGGEAGGVE